MKNSDDSVFMTVGHDWAYKGYLFPAFLQSTTNYLYATKVRVSVFDARNEPTVGKWTAWTDCPVCGSGQTSHGLQIINSTYY